MAALGTIRKRGVTLIIIIGLGLFAFIAEEMFRSCEATNNERRLQVGEVLGEKLSVQDFQSLIDEYLTLGDSAQRYLPIMSYVPEGYTSCIVQVPESVLPASDSGTTDGTAA